MLLPEKCMMHFVFRVGLKMHCIANTWGFVLTSHFMLLIGHKTVLMEAKNVPFGFIALVFRRYTQIFYYMSIF